NPVWRQFTPYGAPRGQTPSSWPDTNGFLGKPTDANTGLTIVGARQYDPATGRFASVDPVLNASAPQSLGGYTYSGDNPVTRSDPSGLCPPVICPGAPAWQPPSPLPAPKPAPTSHPSSGGGGGGGGICYYCHYAPPQYTGGASYYPPPAYYAPSYAPAQGWFPPLAPGFNSPVTSITRALFAQVATSSDSKLNCRGPVEPTSCQTEQDLLGAQYNYNKDSEGGVPRWKKIAVGLGHIWVLVTGGSGQIGNPPYIGTEHPPQTEQGDEGSGAPPGEGEGGGGTTIIITLPGGTPGGDIPPFVIGKGEQQPPEEGQPPTAEESPFVSPPLLPGVIGDFGPGSLIYTGGLLSGW
ncbi:MAG TPA: RHS repeat-associated core domain-containing protein, partial [Streptosporangiaceae bacterium]|nr:RHS repeat-associated core domain-containing protein [Streptosporangiaceae bacterium]